MTSLEEIEARAEAAMPGPWDIALHDADDDPIYHLQPKVAVISGCYIEDLNLIAHAREDIPLLCKALRIAAQWYFTEIRNPTEELGLEDEPIRLMIDAWLQEATSQTARATQSYEENI
jgi:hypothetical protein